MPAIEQDLFWAAVPNVRAAALLIAYDNGMINREESEQDFLEKAKEALCADGVPMMDVIELEVFLSALTEADLDTLCTGEEGEIQAIEALCPNSRVEPTQKVTRLLNDIFEC